MMKKKATGLNVDSIGVQEKPLTKEEEQAISQYLRASKVNRLNSPSNKRQLPNRSKEIEK